MEVSGWTDRHNLKLRRMFKDNIDEHEAWELWIKPVSKDAFKRKVAAYKQQLISVAQQRDADIDAANSQLTEQEDQGGPANNPDLAEQAQHTEQQEIEPPVGEQNGQQDAHMSSSPPELSSVNRKPSPNVDVTRVEQGPAQRNQLQRGGGNEGQTFLSFQRAKRKGAEKPRRESNEDLDRQYGRRPGRASIRHAPPAAASEDPDDKEVVQISSDEESETDVEKLARQLDSQLEPEDMTGVQEAQAPSRRVSISTPPPSRGVVDNRQAARRPNTEQEPQSPAKNTRSRSALNNQASNNDSVDGNLFVSPPPPSRGGVDEKQETSQLDTQQEPQSPAQNTRSRPAGTVQKSLDRNRVIPDSVEDRPDAQLTQELERSALTVARVEIPETTFATIQEHLGLAERHQGDSDDESQAFQTQDPGTTRSQRQKRQCASDASSGAQARTGKLPDVDGPSSRFRRKVSQELQRMTANGPRQLRSQSQSQVQTPTPSQSQNVAPSQTQALIAVHAPVQSQEQPQAQQAQTLPRNNSPPPSQSQQTVRPPLQVLGPPGADGVIEVGRPGFTTKVHKDHPYLMGKKALWAEARKEAKNPEDVQYVFEGKKLGIDTMIAICCEDFEEIKRLKAKERRMRRERGVNDEDTRLIHKSFEGAALAAKCVFHDQAGGRSVDDHAFREDDFTDPGSREDDMADDDWDDDFDKDSHKDSDKEVDDTSIPPIPFPHGVDRKRHFSEVSDEEEDPQANVVDQREQPDAEEDDDDFGLPTLPPPGSLDQVRALTNRDLQDLVQSGDVDVYDEDRNFVCTRPDIAGSSSPMVCPTPESAHGINDEDSAEAIEDSKESAQSGDVDMYDEDRHVIGTRPDTIRSSSPRIRASSNLPGNIRNEEHVEPIGILHDIDGRHPQNGDNRDVSKTSTARAGPKASSEVPSLARSAGEEQDSRREQRQRERQERREKKKRSRQRKNKRASDDRQAMPPPSRLPQPQQQRQDSMGSEMSLSTNASGNGTTKSNKRLKRARRQARKAASLRESTSEASQPVTETRHVKRQVTPIGETQPMERASTPSQQSNEIGSRWWGSNPFNLSTPNFPPAPLPRQEPKVEPVKLPFPTDEEDSSSEESDSD